jgi:hypothetical protein
MLVGRERLEEARLLRAVAGRPLTLTVPASDWISPAQIRISVLLPAPFSPMIATASPGATTSETSSRIDRPP